MKPQRSVDKVYNYGYTEVINGVVCGKRGEKGTKMIPSAERLDRRDRRKGSCVG